MDTLSMRSSCLQETSWRSTTVHQLGALMSSYSVGVCVMWLQLCMLCPPSHPPPPTHTDVAFFRHSLVRYRRQHNQALACPKLKDVGMILVDTNDLREDLLPNPMRCLKVRLSTVLPSVACIHMYIHVYIYTHLDQLRCAHTHARTRADTWIMENHLGNAHIYFVDKNRPLQTRVLSLKFQLF